MWQYPGRNMGIWQFRIFVFEERKTLGFCLLLWKPESQLINKVYVEQYYRKKRDWSFSYLCKAIITITSHLKANLFKLEEYLGTIYRGQNAASIKLQLIKIKSCFSYLQTWVMCCSSVTSPALFVIELHICCFISCCSCHVSNSLRSEIERWRARGRREADALSGGDLIPPPPPTLYFPPI